MMTRRIEKMKKVVAARKKDIVVVVEDVYDPHNVAAIERTCDAFGIQTMYLIFENEQAFDPKRIGKKSSSSANKWLDFHTYTSSEKCFDDLASRGFTIVGSMLDKEAHGLYEYTWPKKTALVLGNEHGGLSSEAQKHCTDMVYIPMQGMVQSLNVSVAAGIFLADIDKKTTDNKVFFTKLEQGKLVKDFLKR